MNGQFILKDGQMDLIMCEIIQPRDNILQVWRFLVGDVRGRVLILKKENKSLSKKLMLKDLEISQIMD